MCTVRNIPKKNKISYKNLTTLKKKYSTHRKTPLRIYI